MSFSDFHGEPNICLFVTLPKVSFLLLELIIRYRKGVMQKLYLMRQKKLGWKTLKNAKN